MLAADAVSAAIVSGRQRHLVFAGVWVGIAFQAKMLEAWLVLPAFGLAYLFGRREGWADKLRRWSWGGGGRCGVPVLDDHCDPHPAADRPYVDGSQHNSDYEQVFVYNGFGRTNQQTAFEQFAGLVGSEIINGPPPALNRLAPGRTRRDTGWLLPAALGSAWRALQPPPELLHPVDRVAGGDGAVFSESSPSTRTTPPDSHHRSPRSWGGVAKLWESRSDIRAWQPVTWGGSPDRGGTVAYGIWLTQSSGANAPGWLQPLAVSWESWPSCS